MTAAPPPPGRFDDAPALMILALVLLPMLFNAFVLMPEATHLTPSANDQVFHYLFIERADQAIAAGDNPFDHWLLEVELGFPEFIYYQNLPHLMVVALHRVLFRQVSLLRLLNLVRYLLMVTFPLTVFWSMRRMDFTSIASAIGAALSVMLSSKARFGFDFQSYTWAGTGMFPQLIAMHLLFIATACVRRAVILGRDYIGAILASSAIILSDLLFGYIFGVIVAVLWLIVAVDAILGRDGLRAGAWKIIVATRRLAMIFVPVGLITAYQTLPFFAQIRYLNQFVPDVGIPYQMFSSTDSRVLPIALASLQLLPITPQQLWMFFGGHFFDDKRLPVITLLVVAGIIYGIAARRDETKLPLAVLIVCMILAPRTPLRLAIAEYVPFITLLPWSRFLGGVDLAAIMLAGLGGEAVWRFCRARTSYLPTALPAMVLAAIFLPLVVERWNFYRLGARAMEATDRALENDRDLQSILSTLKKSQPGRVYAGNRANWGLWMNAGRVHLYELLPVEMFDTVMPWQTLSLNSPLLWQLDVPSPDLCRLFNIRYVIAPPTVTVPDAYHLMMSTQSYLLYQIDSGGYAEAGRIVKIADVHSGDELYDLNSAWMNGPDPGQSRFIAYRWGGDHSTDAAQAALDPDFHANQAAPLASVENESMTPDSFSAEV
ncbi:MAG TPA: hypothetical protein VMT64_13265, partial [Candidatus Binataceae bacterium]|nr:hypothetical protein [Candidatus Binataceae bacterium]